jgi:peptide/nickel transport system permease protein
MGVDMALPQAAVPGPLSDSGRRRAAGTLSRTLRRQWLGAVGLAILTAVIAFAVVYPAVRGINPIEVRLEDKLAASGAAYPLGADQFGRDVATRLAYGARLSLLVALASVAFALVVGTTIGIVAGYVGGWWDEALMRVIDVMLAFPYIVLAIALAATLGPGLTNVIVIIGVIRVPHFARLARSSVLMLKAQEFVLAARAMGQRPVRILLRHLLPNCLTPLFVMMSISAGTAITAEAAMSFLGLGVTPPAASLGNMLSEAQNYVLIAPRLAIWPGLLISSVVLSLNLMGDAMQELVDPRLRTK